MDLFFSLLGSLRQKCGRNTPEIHFSRLTRSFQCHRQDGKAFGPKQVHIRIQESVCCCPSPPCILPSQEYCSLTQLSLGCRNIGEPLPWRLTWRPAVSLLFPPHPASCLVCPALFLYLLVWSIRKLSDPRGARLYFPMVPGILYFSVG